MPQGLRGQLRETDRWEWRVGDSGDPLAALTGFLDQHGLPVADLSSSTHARWPDELAGAALLIGSAAAAASSGAPGAAKSPAPGVPDAVAVIFTKEEARALSKCEAFFLDTSDFFSVGEWTPSWSDEQYRSAVQEVQEEISRGEVYQVNLVGHRAAFYQGSPSRALSALTRLPGARYGGMLLGDGWAVSTATPECQLEVRDGVVRTYPIKGTREATAQGFRDLLASDKERAEHIMIVDLERNDLSRIAAPGTLRVEQLFSVARWCNVWQAESTVSATLQAGVGLAELLRAVLPGGSVTGAPKRAALAQIARLEQVGRGPAMGALGFFSAEGLTLGLTIRTVAADAERLHIWAGGGITWASDPAAEVAEAHAKAAPLIAAIEKTCG